MIIVNFDTKISSIKCVETFKLVRYVRRFKYCLKTTGNRMR